MRGQFQGKVALVTGGNSGIGRATALAFAREGAKVVITARRIKESEETIRMIKEAGGEAIYIKADVSQRSEVETLILKAIERYGRLDFACNNAGMGGRGGFTADCTEEEWDDLINVNLKGVWLCMKYEIAQMLKQGVGVIVNIASTGGLIGVPGQPAYVASKHGVVGLTKAAALEYASASIRVNAICPGGIRTQMSEGYSVANPEVTAQLVGKIPMRRQGKPEEISQAVVWLCTDAASYITGHSMVVDGGYVAQ